LISYREICIKGINASPDISRIARWADTKGLCSLLECQVIH